MKSSPRILSGKLDHSPRRCLRVSRFCTELTPHSVRTTGLRGHRNRRRHCPSSSSSGQAGPNPGVLRIAPPRPAQQPLPAQPPNPRGAERTPLGKREHQWGWAMPRVCLCRFCFLPSDDGRGQHFHCAPAPEEHTAGSVPVAWAPARAIQLARGCRRLAPRTGAAPRFPGWGWCLAWWGWDPVWWG